MFTVNGERDEAEPAMLGVGLGDLAGALVLTLGIVAALLARERYGIGQQINTSHLAACMTLHQFGIALNSFVGYQNAGGDRRNTKTPLWNHYRCKDNTWGGFTHLEADRHWSGFCRALGMEHIEQDPRFSTMMPREANARELTEMIEKAMATKTFGEWDGGLKEYSLC